MRNELSIPLTQCTLVSGSWAYVLGDLQPGDTAQLKPGEQRDLKHVLRGARQEYTPGYNNYRNTATTVDVVGTLEQMLFFQAAGSEDSGNQSNGNQPFVDLSALTNAALTNIGLIDAPIMYLANPDVALWSVLVGVIWQGTPFWTMTFLAGLQSIGNELYEAAEIDGASTFNSFLYITLPSMSSVIIVTAMLSTIFTINGVEFIYILTNGGPAGATTTFPLLALSDGLRAYDLGIGSTIPLLFFPFFAIMIYFLTKRLLQNEGN